VPSERRERDPALCRDVMEELALVLREARLIPTMKRAPHPPVRSLKAFSIGTVQDRNKMVGSGT
jgi:hypothetical protein